MKKLILILAICFISATAIAKTTYIYTDHRFNSVKIESMSKSDAERRKPNQPFTISPDKMTALLKSVKLSRSFVLKKEVETQDVFDDRAVGFLASKISDALAQATNKDQIVISYLTKDPIFIMRNDRITIATLWMQGADLYINFEKLAAKLIGDYDKRGDFSKIIANAKGLRMSLEVRDGQSYGESTGMLVFDTNHDFNGKPVVEEDADESAVKPKAKEGKVVRQPSQDPKGPQLIKRQKVKEGEAVAPAAPVVDVTPKTAKERLKALDQLKEDGLINDKEYTQKRKEIIKGL